MNSHDLNGNTIIISDSNQTISYRISGNCPECGSPIFIKVGNFHSDVPVIHRGCGEECRFFDMKECEIIQSDPEFEKNIEEKLEEIMSRTLNK